MFKSQEQLIAEIHSEFDTAQDRLLEQANQVLSQIEMDAKTEDVANRLFKVGFTNNPLVKKVEDKKKQLVTSKEQAELIKYYKFNYPFLKFLTEEELDRICEKYKLVHAPVDRYIKDVPNKNLRDIETAQPVKEGDEQNWEDLKRLRDLQAIYNRYQYSPEHRGMLDAEYRLYGAGWMWNPINRKEGLFIAAPNSHFNLEGMEKTSKFGWRTEVKDPIVFRYVRGGIQVLTKWGLEAEDPSLIVDKLN